MAAEDVINFLKGHPNPSLLPIDLIKNAAQSALSDHKIAVQALLYGADPGYEPLREQLAEWLNSFYKPAVLVDSQQFCITGGASQNLGCLLGVYTDPKYTRNIWIVAPAYFLAFRIFEDAGFGTKMRAVPEDESGINISFLESELVKSENKAISDGNTKPQYKPDRERAKVYKHVIYCVPSFSNPSSRTMSLDRREALVKLAHKYDALVVSDDVYDFLQWSADIDETVSLQHAHLPRLVDIEASLELEHDGFGHTCSNGSFSKIAGPGLRVGWVQGTKKFAFGVSQAGVQRSGGAPSQLTSTYVAKILESGQLQKHIRDKLCPAYASRYAILMNAIAEHLLPLGFTLPQCDRAVVGGYFIWLGLPLEVSASALTKECFEHENVIIISGEMFEVPGDNISFSCNIRLCLAWEEPDKMTEGVKRIARCAKRLMTSQYVMVNDA